MFLTILSCNLSYNCILSLLPSHCPPIFFLPPTQKNRITLFPLASSTVILNAFNNKYFDINLVHYLAFLMIWGKNLPTSTQWASNLFWKKNIIQTRTFLRIKWDSCSRKQVYTMTGQVKTGGMANFTSFVVCLSSGMKILPNSTLYKPWVTSDFSILTQKILFSFLNNI